MTNTLGPNLCYPHYFNIFHSHWKDWGYNLAIKLRDDKFIEDSDFQHGISVPQANGTLSGIQHNKKMKRGFKITNTEPGFTLIDKTT